VKLLPFVLGLVGSGLLLRADPPPGYYAAAEGKRGLALRQALHGIVRNHRVIPYASGAQLDTSDALRVLDQDPANSGNVVGIYSRLSRSKASFGLAAGWNREHLWCNGYGIESREPAYSDLHNLRAEDMTVNSDRGNKYFDESNPSDPEYANPAGAEALLSSTDSDSWEPPEFVKGDIARAMFYMAVRYMGDAAGEPALTLTDAIGQITASGSSMGRHTVLVHWHLQDPVDAAEAGRNDAIYRDYQRNRNPFVDRPEWVLEAFMPQLTLSVSGTSATLEWAADASPIVVLEATRTAISNWSTVTNVPTQAGAFWKVTLPLEPEERFFRLRLP